MQDNPQPAQPHWGMNIPAGIDPRAYDPRKVMDSAAIERMIRAQEAARAQAQAATTVLLGTVVTLITSAFGFVAALAWNDAIQGILSAHVNSSLAGYHLSTSALKLIYALIVTVIAVVTVVILNRIAGNMAKKSAIGGNGN